MPEEVEYLLEMSMDPDEKVLYISAITDKAGKRYDFSNPEEMLGKILMLQLQMKK